MNLYNKQYLAKAAKIASMCFWTEITQRNKKIYISPFNIISTVKFISTSTFQINILKLISITSLFKKKKYELCKSD